MLFEFPHYWRGKYPNFLSFSSYGCFPGLPRVVLQGRKVNAPKEIRLWEWEMAESVNVLADGKFVQLVDKDGWEYVRRKNISGIAGLVARTDEGRMVLVEQYRPPVGADVIELPAGLGDVDGEPLIDCGRRELIEETGYEAGSVKLLVSGAASAGSTAEILTMYLATDLKKVGDGGGDHSENITVHEIPLDEVEAWLDRQAEAGKVIDLKIYLGLYYLMK